MLLLLLLLLLLMLLFTEPFSKFEFPLNVAKPVAMVDDEAGDVTLLPY